MYLVKVNIKNKQSKATTELQTTMTNVKLKSVTFYLIAFSSVYIPRVFLDDCFVLSVLFLNIGIFEVY